MAWPAVFSLLALVAALPSQAQQASSGHSQNLGAFLTPYDYTLPVPLTSANILATAIAQNDRVYTWYNNGLRTVGTTSDLDKYDGFRSYSPPFGRTLVAAAISSQNKVYYYWDDGTRSKGSSTNPTLYGTFTNVSFPPGLTAQDLRGIGIAGSDDHVYAWFSNGRVSEGSSIDLDEHAPPIVFTMPAGFSVNDLAGIAIAGSDDDVYAWYHPPSFGEAPANLAAPVDDLVLDFIDNNGLAGATVSVSKNGKMVLNKSYGSANLTTGQPMQPFHRARIGSSTKVLTAMAVLKHAEEIDAVQGDADLGVLDRKIYGPLGWLPDFSFPGLDDDWEKGWRRHTPVVGTFIRKTDDRVLTFYDDGTYSLGTTSNLATVNRLLTYTLPNGQTAQDIRGIASDNTGFVYTWYRDGSLSRGTPADLDSEWFIQSSSAWAVRPPAGKTLDQLVGIGMAGANGATNSVYSFYEDGTKSWGGLGDLGANHENIAFDPAPGKTPGDIRSVAIAKNNHVHAFYGDDTVSAGTTTDLSQHKPLYGTQLSSAVTAQDWPAWYADISMRHLLSHTSGLNRDSNSGAAAAMFNSPEKTLGYEKYHRYTLQSLPMLYQPGNGSIYSNHGIGLAAWALEVDTGVPFKTYLDLEILSPLGLSMGLLWDPLTFKDAMTHTVDAAGTNACACSYPRRWGEARGGLTGTAADLVRLMLATDQKTNHPDILLPSTLNEMESQQMSGISWRGLGWRRTTQAGGGLKLSHNGSIGGGMSEFAKYQPGYQIDTIDVGDINVAIVTNTRGSNISMAQLVDDIAKATALTPISPFYDLH